MTSTAPPVTVQPDQQQQQPAQGQAQQQGLPPTGLQQQLASLNSQYDQWRNTRYNRMGATGSQRSYNVGVDVRGNAAQQNQSLPGLTGAVGQQQPGQPQQAMQATGEPDARLGASTSLNALAERLAQNYGLSVGRGELVDQGGNFLFTPDQLVASSGGQETLGTAAAKMNYIASALQKQQTQQNMKKSEAALQAGLGLTSQRRSGSMIEQQQQFYQGLANLYQNQDYEAADYSYWINKEKQDTEMAILNKIEKLNKKKAKGQFWGGAVTAAIGFATQNYAMAAQGLGTAAGSGGEAGYF